jgi:hypothetical protein
MNSFLAIFVFALVSIVTVNADDKALLHPDLNKPTSLVGRDT